MGTVYRRGTSWWVRWRELDGNPKSKNSGYSVTDPDGKSKARAAVEAVEVEVKAGIRPELTGPLTVSDWYYRYWLPAREVKGMGKESEDVRRYALTHIGKLRLDEVKPRHIITVIEATEAADYSPRTIWRLKSQLNVMFRDAIVAERITHTPCVVSTDTMPARVDKDPTWRAQAFYHLHEVGQLISDERVAMADRVLYAIKCIGGVRHGEAVGLTWSDYDLHSSPLRTLVASVQYTRKNRTKTKAVKIFPVHPALAAILDAYRATLPDAKDTDFIVPRVRGSALKTGPAQAQLDAYQKALGLRRRKGHDMRATFITALEEAGVPSDVTDKMTHPTARANYGGYVRGKHWRPKCEAILKLSLDVPAWACGYAQVTTVLKSAVSMVVGVKTVLSRTSSQTYAEISTSEQARTVSTPTLTLVPADAGPKRNDVTVTPGALDALEAAARAMLEALATLRR